jgi:L-ascorbate metabolism protein UlaG (beta-lactamase superfamily)
MDIYYLGHSSFKLKGKNAVLITDPFSEKMTGLKFPKSEADIVTISHNHEDHNQSGLIDGGPYVISNPGEYEVKNVSVFGIEAFHDNHQGQEKGKNTIFVIEMDKMRICHLGDLGHKLDEKELEEVDGVDILMIPVGGSVTVNPAEAMQVVNQIEPKIVLPMHYNEEGLNQQIFKDLAPLSAFLKEAGDKIENLPKLTVSFDSLPEEKQQIVVLERKNG